MSRRDRVLTFAVSAGGLGLLPGMPGTFGTLLGAGIYVAASALPEPFRSVLVAAAFFGFCVLTVAAGHWAERHWGRKDPQRVVTDEVAGVLLATLGYRIGTVWQIALWAFVAFRLFDTLKPIPARRLEHLRYGWGVLLDDLAAALWAIGLLYALAFLSRPLGFSRLFWP